MKRRFAKKALIFSLLVLFISSGAIGIISPILGPSTASADVKGKADQNSRTILYALVHCLRDDEFQLPGGMTKGEMQSGTTFAAGSVGASEDREAAVGYEVDTEDGNASCENIHLDNLSLIGKDAEWLFKIMYPAKSTSALNTYCVALKTTNTQTSKKGDCNGDFTIMRSLGKDYREIAASKIESGLKSEGAFPGISQGERERRLAFAFMRCNEIAKDGTRSSDIEKYNGKKYTRIDGGPTDISVGYDMEKDDGKYKCDILLHWGKKAEMESALKNHGDEASAAAAASGVGGASGTDDETPSCESSGYPLSWIICGIINGLADALDSIYSEIVEPLLETDPINLSNPGDDPTNTYAVWSTFRIYGNIILVLALLVIVFGEAIGGGILDAYAVKKILPRLLIAVILVNLSIYIVALAVDVSNILGKGLESLIEAPFRGAASDGFKVSIGGGAGTIGFGALVLGGAAGGIWAAAFTGPFLQFLFLFFLIPAFLTMMSVMITILIRMGLIIFLIMISPVAFALYCLPNTEKYFKQWWDMLLKTLLVYPIMGVIFAIANVLSVTISKTSSGLLDTLADFMAIFALMVPLFLIPFAFRIAGGVMAQASGLIQDRKNQLSAPLKSYRSRKLKEHGAEVAQKAASGQFFRNANKSGIQDKLNRRIGQAANSGAAFKAIGKPGFGLSSMKGHVNEQLDQNAEVAANTEEAKKRSAAFNRFHGNDTMNEAAVALGRHGDTAARQYLADNNIHGAEQEQMMGLLYSAQQDLGSSALVRAASMANHSTGSAMAGGGGESLASIIGTQTGSALSEGNMVAESRGRLKQSGRSDSVEGFGATIGDIAYIKAAKDEAEYAERVEQVNDKVAVAALETATPGELAQMRKEGHVNIASALGNRLGQAEANMKATANGDEVSVASWDGETGELSYESINHAQATERWKQEQAAASVFIDTAGSSSTEARRIYADGPHATKTKISDLPPDIQKQLTETMQPVMDPVTQRQKIGADNQPEMQSVKTFMPDDGMITQAQIQDRLAGDEAFKRMKKTYDDESKAKDAARMQQEAAAAAAPPAGEE